MASLDVGCGRTLIGRRDDEVTVGETSWAFLLVGTFAAVGAAMAIGTLAALLRYHRTGVFPGAQDSAEITTARLTRLWLRVAVGVVLAVIGVVAIDRAGIW